MKPDFSNDAAVEAHIDAYRYAVGRLRLEDTEEGRAEWSILIKALRQQWADWQGKDNLHETASPIPRDVNRPAKPTRQ